MFPHLWFRIRVARLGREAHAIDPANGARACGGRVDLTGYTRQQLEQFVEEDREVPKCEDCRLAVARLVRSAVRRVRRIDLAVG